jgi:putative nucleotidyltransferase with HDIG domain
VSRHWKGTSGKSKQDSAHKLSFTTRSALTVSLQSQKLEKGQRTIGGLMALTSRDSAFDDEDMELLQILAEHLSGMLDVSQIVENAQELYLDVIKALVASLDAKDPHTQGHSLRVSEYSVALAQAMGMGEEEVSLVRIASLLHDVGKIGISDSLLRKSGMLTPEEFEIMKTHTLIGGKILKQVRVLETALPGIVEHHERLDGSGYPLGLMGNEMSLMGKIIAIADVFDAMTSDRPYRPALDRPSALHYLQENGGKLFDAQAVEVFASIADSVCTNRI